MGHRGVVLGSSFRRSDIKLGQMRSVWACVARRCLHMNLGASNLLKNMDMQWIKCDQHASRVRSRIDALMIDDHHEERAGIKIKIL